MKIENRTKEDQVYDILRESIIECELPPGEKLVIDQISQQMNISTIPIRAAIQRLGMEGLVEIRPHAPARIAEISIEMIRETFMLLSALEQVAFETLAREADPDKINLLESLVEEMSHLAAKGSRKVWAQKNIEFHLQLAKLTEMPLLFDYTNRTFDQWRRLSNFYFRKLAGTRISQAQAEHVKLISHIKKHEVEEAINLARQHNQAAFESYDALIQQEGRETL